MKKNDLIIVGVLVALMFAWMSFYPALEKKFFPRPEQPVEQTPSPEPELVPAAEPEAPVVVEAVAEETIAPAVELPDAPEVFQTLENEDIELTVSSYGGSIVSAVLNQYRAENTKDSGPVVLDFAEAPALRYSGLPVSAGTFEETDGGLVYTAVLDEGRTFERTIKLTGQYLLSVEDRFVNNSELPWTLPKLGLPTGPMSNPPGTHSMRGLSTLGVDTFAAAQGVEHKKLDKLFKNLPASQGLVPAVVAAHPVDWVAAKNKFFIQILTADNVADGFDVFARIGGDENKPVPVAAAAALRFDAELIGAGETVNRTAQVYIGPKDYSFLKTQGMEQVEVMEFKSTSFWSFMNPVMVPIKKGLLWGLIALYKVVRNYGVAIMLLTIIVRVIFWPITHKGTESMRRMQSLQPQMQAIKEKYKDNPQRMNQEMMAFYKENKVNPMGGCLPMVVQIPVFIALFSVLRSAIELRFSKFLWISDLSEPENLFEGMIPIAGSLNILPLLMSATMYWQQKLTSGATAITPEQQQQQKMMAVMMPVMMLFFFYTMPSGLVLYWTTSQLLMIGQMLIKKKKEA